ncbi:hypothetical protein J6590_018187 [Homalodisca vitripennis]|nr:hypothetical protein J6590_018187 [Homalodisca vitripennis]
MPVQCVQCVRRTGSARDKADNSDRTGYELRGQLGPAPDFLGSRARNPRLRPGYFRCYPIQHDTCKSWGGDLALRGVDACPLAVTKNCGKGLVEIIGLSRSGSFGLDLSYWMLPYSSSK